MEWFAKGENENRTNVAVGYDGMGSGWRSGGDYTRVCRLRVEREKKAV